MAEVVTCGYLIRDEESRPCVLKPRHKSPSHRDAKQLQLKRQYMNGYDRSNYQKTTTARVKWWRDIVNSYKLSKGCERCGYNEAAIALDLDHLDRTTKVASISRLAATFNPENPIHLLILSAEMEKCRVLCANCHRIKTQEAGDSTPKNRVHRG